MTEQVKPLHIQMIAVFVMFIGLLLFSAMILITLSNDTVLTGIAFKMSTVGLIAGAIIAALGAILFRFPKLGQWGAN